MTDIEMNIQFVGIVICAGLQNVIKREQYYSFLSFKLKLLCIERVN